MKIKDFSEVLNGYAFKSSNYINNGYRVIRITNVQSGYLEDEKPVFYERDNKLNKYELKENDVLISLTGNVGRCAMVTNKFLPAYLNQRVCCLRVNEKKIIPRFLYYILNSKKFELDCINSSQGIAQLNMSTEWLKEYNIDVPTIDEQKKIIDVFDKVYKNIDIRKKQIKQCDELVKSQFVEMFGNYNTIFEKWENEFIDNIASVIVGIVITPSKYYTDSSGVKTFRSLNVGEMKIKDTDWVYLTEEGNNINKKSILHENQVLVVRSGKPGISCVVTKEYDGCNAIDVIIATPNTKIINPVYMASFTNYEPGMNQIINGQNGVAQKHFNVKSYQNLKIAVPPIELQNKFAQIVEQIDKQKFVIANIAQLLAKNSNYMIK